MSQYGKAQITAKDLIVQERVPVNVQGFTHFAMCHRKNSTDDTIYLIAWNEETDTYSDTIWRWGTWHAYANGEQKRGDQ